LMRRGPGSFFITKHPVTQTKKGTSQIGIGKVRRSRKVERRREGEIGTLEEVRVIKGGCRSLFFRKEKRGDFRSSIIQGGEPLEKGMGVKKRGESLEKDGPRSREGLRKKEEEFSTCGWTNPPKKKKKKKKPTQKRGQSFPSHGKNLYQESRRRRRRSTRETFPPYRVIERKLEVGEK